MTKAQPSAAPPRAWNLTLWAVQVILAAWMLLAALAKFTGATEIVATFNAIGLGDWFRYLIAALEVLGAVALLIPRLAGIAALAFVALLIGATITQILLAGAGAATPLTLLVLAAFTAWGRRSRTQQLWAQLNWRITEGTRRW